MRRLLAAVIASSALIAGCGGGDSTPTTGVAYDPLPLTSVHEWAYADVGLPGGWTVTGEIPGGFVVSTEPDLSPGFGLEQGQVKVTIGYHLNAPSLDVPLTEHLASSFERWDLTAVDSISTTKLGHPTEIVTATGDDFAQYEARVLTGPATAFILSAYVAPDDLARLGPTFEAMIDTAVLKGLLADE